MRDGVVAAALAAALITTGGCRPALRPEAPAAPVLEPVAGVSFTDDGDVTALAAAVRASATYYGRLPPEQTIDVGAARVTAARMHAAFAALATFLDRAPRPEVIAAEIERRFVAYRAVVPDDALFTGYYLPAVSARAKADRRFRYPVLGRPHDLVTVVARDFDASCAQEIAGRVENGKLRRYYTRAEIAAGALRDAPVLGWVDDPVALFFLQVQGSGSLVFPNGARPIGFAGSNGHPYVSIGKMLVDEGSLGADDASMQGIRSWLAAHPAEEARVLNANPRYVFFRTLDGPALGSLGVPVTAGRSIATDPAIYPPGALAYVRLHDDDHGGDRAIARCMLNQDRGAAIRGPARVDVFFGAGPEAEAIAGRTKTRGELYFFAPR